MKKHHLFTGFLFIMFSICSCYNDDFLVKNTKESILKNDFSGKNLNNNLCGHNRYKYDYPKPSFRVEQKDNFMWGINGHSIRPEYPGYENQYRKFSLEEEINFLNELNVGIYRIDLHLKGSSMYNERHQDLEDFLVALDAFSNIQLLCVLESVEWRHDPVVYDEVGSNWNYGLLLNYLNSNNPLGSTYIKTLPTWNYYYNISKAAGLYFGSEFGDRMEFYNIGNELALNLVKNYYDINNTIDNDIQHFFLNYKGDEMSDFFLNEEMAKRTIATLAFVNGLIDGIQQSDPDNNAKFIINETNLNFGYFKLLNYVNTEYDIIGWNWYFGEKFNSPNSQLQGMNAYQNLISLGNQPIWIIEANKRHGNLDGDNSDEIRTLMEIMYNTPRVEGFLIYELIDSEYIGEPYENYYGLLTTPINNLWGYKPAFNTFRFSIEEFQYGYHDFAYSYYLI